MRKLFSYLLIYLLFAPIVHAWDGVAFSSRAGVDPTGLVVALRPLHSTLQDQRDRSRQDNDFEQLTVGNQYSFASSMNAAAPVWDYDGSDFTAQKVYASKVGDINLISKDGEAAVIDTGQDLSIYATPSGTTPLKYRIVLNDGTPDTAWAYIGEADAAEAFGAEIFDSPDFDGAGWGNSAQWTIAGEKAIYDATGLGYLTQAKALTEGKSYVLMVDVVDGSGAARLSVANQAGIGFAGYTTFADGVRSIYFTPFAGVTGVRIYGTNADGGGAFKLESASLKEVTALGTTAVHLYDDPQASNRILTGDTGIDPNAITTMEIYKTIGTTNLTGDMTVLMWVKPDDGNPSPATFLFSKDVNVVGNKGFYVRIQTDGDIDFVRRDVDQDTEVFRSTGVFSNGTQASFTACALVLDTIAGTGKIYANGVDVSDTSSITANTTYDTWATLNIAESTGSFFNGQIAAVLIFERALTAAEVQQFYLQGLEEGLMSLN